jgi:hypothetical protein
MNIFLTLCIEEVEVMAMVDMDNNYLCLCHDHISITMGVIISKIIIQR